MEKGYSRGNVACDKRKISLENQNPSEPKQLFDINDQKIFEVKILKLVH